MPWWEASKRGVVLSVRVGPNARRTEITRIEAARLWIRVAAPALEDRANTELCRFLAQELRVRASSVTVQRGLRSRDKQVLVAGMDGPPAFRHVPASGRVRRDV